MPDPILKALFVTLSLALLWQLGELLPHVRGPGSRCLIHSLSGLCSLLAANAAGAPFGFGVGLNALTLPVSLFLGLPGTALLWALRYFV